MLRAKFLWSDGFFCLINICKSGDLKSPFAMIISLSELCFQKIYPFVTEKNDFHELWLQHKLLKTMEVSEAWSDNFDEGYIQQSQPGPTHKIH